MLKTYLHCHKAFKYVNLTLSIFMLSFLCEERTIKCAEEIQLCCSPTQTTLSESGQAAYFAGLPSSLRLVPKQRLVLFVSGVQRATIEAGITLVRSLNRLPLYMLKLSLDLDLKSMLSRQNGFRIFPWWSLHLHIDRILARYWSF